MSEWAYVIHPQRNAFAATMTDGPAQRSADADQQPEEEAV